MIKIVYLIASHTNPEQVIRLVKTLKTGNSFSAVVLHQDYSKSFLTSDHHFARKFDSNVDVEILDIIDRLILRQPSESPVVKH